MRKALTVTLLLLVTLTGNCHFAYSQAPKPDEMTRRWDIARSMIIHEDSLISGRLSSFLTLQGLLFAVLGIVVKAYVEQEAKRLPGSVRAFSMVIGLVGVWSSYITYHGVKAAYDQNERTITWWTTFLEGQYGKAKVNEMQNEAFINFSLPRIVGDYKSFNMPEKLPLGLMVAWIFLVGLMIWMFVLKPLSVRAAPLKELSSPAAPDIPRP